MTIFLTVPGMKKEKIVVSDTATLADFCRRAFEQTGIRLFNGFGYKSQNGTSYLVPTDAVITKQAPFDNRALVTAPVAPGTATSGAGALAATTYFVKVAYVNATGEALSPESSQAALINTVLVVTSPAASADASVTGYNVYVSNTAGGGSGTETRQNGGTPIAIGTNWTEPTSGLVAGVAMPSSNTTGQAAVAMTTVSYGTAITSVFNNNDEVQLYTAVPVGG